MNKIYTRKENTSQTWQLLGLQTYTRNDNTKQTWGQLVISVWCPANRYAYLKASKLEDQTHYEQIQVKKTQVKLEK